MRFGYLLAGLFVLLGARLAFAAYLLPAYESFPKNYADNVRLRDLAAFDAGNSAGSGSNLTNSWSAGLSYPGLVTSNDSGGVLANGTPNSGRDAGFQLSPAFTFSAGTPMLYASFLLKVQTPTTTTNLLALFAGGTGGGATPVAGVYLDQNNRLWISKSAVTPATSTAGVLTVGDTNLVVIRYRFDASAPDEVALWVNPGASSFGTNEAHAPAPTLVTTNGTDSSNVAAFDFAHRTTSGTAVGATGVKLLDEVRVGTTWAQVTPPVGSGGGPIPQPVITHVLLLDGNVVLRGTNGVTNGVYQILSVTDLSLATTNWPAIATNLFDSAGNFDVTNSVSLVDGPKFFRLRVGGTLPPPPVAPTITAQPLDQVVTVSNSAAFSVTATGDAPLRYQWFFNTNMALANATNATFTIASTTTADAGKYSVVVTNAAGAATSAFATLTVVTNAAGLPDFNLHGFGAPASGGGLLPETDPSYRKVYTPGDLRLALASSATKVIEIMNDLNLGWHEIGVTNQTGALRSSTAPSLHPVLLASGVTTVDIQDKNGLTVFSANGATIRHAEFNVKRTHNLLLRNLKFDELWEWDEATTGDYDSKDWDFITIGDSGACTNVWIDHCDFTKSYDGVVDIKGGYNNVTISWCRFLGDGDGLDSFTRRQFLYLETNGVPEAMFDFLRANGFSLDDLVTIARSQKKGHLLGATALDPANAGLQVTLHHNYYLNFQDRMPRLRAGNAHIYNVHLNNTEALAAKNLRDARVAAIPGGLGSYKFDVTLNGAISTEDGAVLVEKCHLVDTRHPLRNNQTDPNNPAYTGKIRAADTIYTLNGVTFRGDTEDPGSPLIPVPAAVKPFAWNGFGSLPYAYPLNDPADVSALLVTNGFAGAGTIIWAKANWLKTTY